jgi:hypothetical protein
VQGELIGSVLTPYLFAKIVFVEDNHVEADLQGATDHHEVLRMFFA